MCDHSNRIMRCKAQIRMLKGEWWHSVLHTLYYILVTKAQVDSVARVEHGPEHGVQHGPEHTQNFNSSCSTLSTFRAQDVL